jgi:hypothetical protein
VVVETVTGTDIPDSIAQTIDFTSEAVESSGMRPSEILNYSKSLLQQGYESSRQILSNGSAAVSSGYVIARSYGSIIASKSSEVIAASTPVVATTTAVATVVIGPPLAVTYEQ